MGGHRMSALVQAGREFVVDEKRRRARGQKPRMEAEELQQLEAEIRSTEATTIEHVDLQHEREARGLVAIGIFGYTDTVDEQAATVITDILHAAAARGFSPQAVLDQAALYYAEERPH